MINVKRMAALVLGLLVLFSFPARGDIVFDDGFNFRDFRIDPPLNYTSGDLLVFGVVITDTDTGDVPAGAIVRAQNQLSGEEVVMNRFGNEYSRSLPYTTDRAAGDWVIEVNSDVGSASVFIPAFGTGPGTGQMPGVENLSVIPGAQPTFTWTLPTDILSQNGGNVDRLRLRIFDSNDDQLIDDRFDNTVTDTSYTVDPGVIDHNGAFVGQLLVEGFNPFNRSRSYATFVVENAGTGGQAVGLSGVFHFRGFRGDNSIGWRTGDRHVVGVNVDFFNDTYVHLEQDGVVLQAFPSNDLPSEYSTSFEYSGNLADIWDIIAWNGAVQTTTQSHPLGPLEQLPLVTNIRIEPDDLTPTIKWDLPVGNTVPFDEILIGLFDDVTDFRIFKFGPNQDGIFDSLPSGATSYKFEPGVLEAGGRYVVRVVLRDSDSSDRTINRSVTFFNFTPIPGSGGEVFLPTLDAGGIYNFDFDVTEAVEVTIDPEVAVGYIYEIGENNPRFSSVELPDKGDGIYDLTVYDDSDVVIFTGTLAAGVNFDFTALDPTGIPRFDVTGIEVSAGLDPLDTTAFMTKVTFASSGRFTGTMTPIVVEVEEPEALACDADLSGTVDITDVRAIIALRNQPASGPDDPLDWDGDGTISVLDARGCVSECTLPRCAVN